MAASELEFVEQALEERAWMLAGLCRTRKDRSIFFPTTPNSSQGKIAKALCKKCPVRTSCYMFALRHHEFGVWGGTDEWERALHRVILGNGLLEPTPSANPDPMESLRENVKVTTSFSLDLIL